MIFIRIWHYKLLPYLPKSQLLAQKRECDLIWRDRRWGKKTNHILINYIWEYDINNFVSYYYLLRKEFENRGFNFKDKSNWGTFIFEEPFSRHHNNEYLTICFWNLREKHLRGQKDFTDECWNKLQQFYEKFLKENRK